MSLPNYLTLTTGALVIPDCIGLGDVRNDVEMMKIARGDTALNLEDVSAHVGAHCSPCCDVIWSKSAASTSTRIITVLFYCYYYYIYYI